MALISQEKFQKIANHSSDVCVSIFIPTSRAGKEVLEHNDEKHLKSSWDEIKRKLEKQEVSEDTIEAIGKPIEELINHPDFWRHQSDGLAIFASKDFFERFTIPVNFEAYTHISKEFYVRPLVPVMKDEGRFYLLSIQQDNVELFEATRHSIGPVYIKDLTPERLQDRVGYDYEEKHRNHSTQGSQSGQTTFHGYDAANRDDKNEILRFFRAVDKGLSDILNTENVPLVIACQDYLFPIYKEANTYNNLYEDVVPGNPNDTDMLGLHDKALKVMESELHKEERSKLKEFKELNPEKTSSEIHDIIPAAFEGKIDTLFLESRAEVWGTYDEKSRKVTVEEEHSQENTSLMNLAAAKVIETGGSVFLIETAFMPQKAAKLNAIYRYS